MTTTGLIVLIVVLSVARGVFVLFPGILVRAFWVKLSLLCAITGIAVYAVSKASVPLEMGEDPSPLPPRYIVVFLIALFGTLMLPHGQDPALASSAADRGDTHPPEREADEGPGRCGTEIVESPLAESLPGGPAPRPDAPSGLLHAFLAPTRRVWNESQKKTMLEYMDSVIIAGITALFLIWYLVRSFYIPSESMVPTLQINDMILVDELAYRIYKPGRGDIVVFHPPEKANSEGKDFIKRVIAVEGDTVHVKNDITYVNGTPIDEPYRNPERSEYDSPSQYEPLTVPPGQVFCMGDNRARSDDSRYWGTLPVENIIGKAFLIFYPFDRAGALR